MAVQLVSRALYNIAAAFIVSNCGVFSFPLEDSVVRHSSALRKGQQSHDKAGPTYDILVEPQPNDTLSANYWSSVNTALRLVGLSTALPQPAIDDGRGSNSSVYHKVLSASRGVPRKGSQEGVSIEDYHLAQNTEADLKTRNVVPWDMALGASIMSGVSPGAKIPVVSQESTSSRFIAQCPLVMFGDRVSIRPPHCSIPMGEWRDPTTDRAVLRWRENGRAGLYFGVDSSVTGNGSVTFADLNRHFNVAEYQFDLFNCLHVMRYRILEQVMEVHQLRKSDFFYKYIITHPNGSSIAQTSLFKRNQNQINISMVGDKVSAGPTVAIAQREGSWIQDGWRHCSTSRREWFVSFPTAPSTFDQVASVQDLRVAAAALITLMAYRDETTRSNGIQSAGSGQMWWLVLRKIVMVLILIIILYLAGLAFNRMKWNTKCRRLLMQVEEAILPPQRKRISSLNKVY